MKLIAIQHNSEGRPCGWGLTSFTGAVDYDAARAASKAEAIRQYDAHSCYPGERKGKLQIRILPEAE